MGYVKPCVSYTDPILTRWPIFMYDFSFVIAFSILTHKHLEMHVCILNTVATDALVLKQQAISIHSADPIFFVLDQFHTEQFHLQGLTLANGIII